MFTTAGFLGTKALLFMDIITIYFAILPFLLFYSITFAIRKEYKKHFISQGIILCVTIIFVLIFEVGVRLSGGFIEYVQNNTLSYNFLLSFLIVHIVIAIFAFLAWVYLFISSYKMYKENKFKSIKNTKHKRMGKIVFFFLCLTSLMGVLIYIFLFVL